MLAVVYSCVAVLMVVEVESPFVNVAWKKAAFVSTEYPREVEAGPWRGVDGRKGRTDYVHIAENDTEMNWFVIDLIHSYQVKYIHLFNRECPDCEERMDHFIIGTTNTFDPTINKTIRNRYQLCGQWPTKAFPPFRAMRIDCLNPNAFSRFVILQQDVGKSSMGFTELEVYTDGKPIYTKNLALNKPVYFSTARPGDMYDPKICVDGNFTPDNIYCLQGLESPPYKNWFAIDLLREHMIVYVVLYGRTDCCVSDMDYFVVGLTNKFDPQVNTTVRNNYRMCGHWKSAALVKGMPMRVTCEDDSFHSRFVIIQQSDLKNNSGLGFKEVEVYANDPIRKKYFGCFRNFRGEKTFPNQHMGKCIALCRNANLPFATMNVENFDDCICGSVVGYPVSSINCLVNCTNDKRCIVRDFFTVFEVSEMAVTTQPEMGCFREKMTPEINENLMLISDGESSCRRCIAHCFKSNFLYASINSLTCQCGNTYDTLEKVSESHCNVKCATEQSNNCGGSVASRYVNLFLTGYIYGLEMNPYERYHCLNGTKFDGLNECQECEPGWTGRMCKERDCAVNNGACGSDKCVTHSFAYANISECECRNGYAKVFAQGDCRDFHECDHGEHTCNLNTSHCVNTHGSYRCVCRSGYIRSEVDPEDCVDINECNDDNPCSYEHQVCHNTPGSYQCSCQPGFHVDECCTKIDKCDRSRQYCTNTIGSHICQDHGEDSPTLKRSLTACVALSILFIISTATLAFIIVYQSKRLLEIKNAVKILYSGTKNQGDITSNNNNNNKNNNKNKNNNNNNNNKNNDDDDNFISNIMNEEADDDEFSYSNPVYYIIKDETMK
ncbi:hypothetical protein HELRODRAFT_173373 [Helobdella robusta]|uniref:EGF-like domain-containing protein n=1 Tax=Helobdella robusta TaxID=6412 RepID=T1F6Q7_HELRO|nr:hypothetical protein HELRODRAFT_173373 [Helobdella robusta]ESO03675.1 hypothetical protein HELRODRAFT_173373 [Helobdella robusta]